MKEQIYSLLLQFDVIKVQDQYELKLRKIIHKVIPLVFPRHLDNMQRHSDKLICVQDTANDEEFTIIVLDTQKNRRDKPDCLEHKTLQCIKLV